MTDSSREPADRANELLDRARADPNAVDPRAFDPLLASEHPRARRYAVDGLQLLAARDPAVLNDRAERLAGLLTDSDSDVRAGAADAFAGVLNAATVAKNANTLAELLDDDFPVVRWNALEALVRAAREDPDACRPFVDDVVAFLDADTDNVRKHAAMFLAAVSTEHPTTVVPYVEQLVDVLGSDVADEVGVEPSMWSDSSAVQSHVEQIADEVTGQQRDLRTAAGRAIHEVATAEPMVVASRRDAVVALLDDPDPQIRQVALDALSAIADASPAKLVDHADAVAAPIGDDHEALAIRATACRVLTAIGADDPAAATTAAVAHVDVIRRLLDCDNPSVRASAAALLTLAADHDADAVAAELGDADIEAVRSTAADALDDQ